MNTCKNRLWYDLDCVHQRCANLQYLAHRHEVLANHVGKIVTGREDWPIGGQKYPACLALSHFTKSICQFKHMLERERIAALRIIHGDCGKITFVLQFNQFIWCLKFDRHGLSPRSCSYSLTERRSLDAI